MEALKRETYKDRIIALVSRVQGATTEELLAMTNWQPHTLGLSGTLRKSLPGGCESGRFSETPRRDGWHGFCRPGNIR